MKFTIKNIKYVIDLDFGIVQSLSGATTTALLHLQGGICDVMMSPFSIGKLLY